MKKKPEYNTPPTAEEIRRYLAGEMTEAEKNAIERRLQSSQFSLEAEEGFEQLSALEFQEDIDNLRNRIKGKQKALARSLWSQPLKIAAGIAIAFIFSWLLIEYLNVPEKLIIDYAETTTPEEEIITIPDAPEEDLLSYKEEDQEIQEEEPAAEISEPGDEMHEEEDLSLDVKIDAEDIAEKEAKEKPAKTAITKKELQDEFIAINERLSDSIKIGPSAHQEMELSESVAPNETLDQAAVSKSVRSKALAPSASALAPTRSDLQLASQATEPLKISGKILSSDDLTPLPGVNVIVKGTTIGTVSDIEGNFSLTLPDTTGNTLVISFIGLETAEFEVEDQSYVEITLDNDVTQLSEVVVTGYSKNAGDEEPPVVTKAKPVDGYSAFRRYIKENMRYPASTNEGKSVKVEFSVEPDGKISNLKVTNMPGLEFEKEAIRLIREGPEWVPATVNGIPQQEKVKIKMRFKPPKE